MRILPATILVLTTVLGCTPETQSSPAPDEAPAVVAFLELPDEKAGTAQENPKGGLKYVWIPPGKFMMGCSEGDRGCLPDENPAHEVTISKGFWMGQTEVTVGAYKRFANATGRTMPNATGWNPDWRNEQMPMTKATWGDADAYCRWAGGRLPTEAEWEYSARAGSTIAVYGPLDEIAWTWAKGRRGPSEVAMKRPNDFGLFDTLGNEYELVNDWYVEDYFSDSPATDPTGPPSGVTRVVRGGEWAGIGKLARVSARRSWFPDSSEFGGVFRCALQPGP